MYFSATRTQPAGGHRFRFFAILGLFALLAGCNGKDVSVRDAHSSGAVQTADVKTGWSGTVERDWSDPAKPAVPGKNEVAQKPGTDYESPGENVKEQEPDQETYPGLIAGPGPGISDAVDGNDAGANDPAKYPAKPAESLPAPPQKLTWHPPLTREDGTSLYPGEIAGYRIYYKKAHLSEFQLVPLNDATDTDLSLDGFSPGVYHFAISTIDVNGLESRRSTVVKVNVT